MARRLVGIAVSLCASSSLFACGDSDTYISFGGRANGEPVFCISEKANCAAPGGTLNALTVEELDDAGKVVNVTWAIKPSKSAFLLQREVAYGVLPVGWQTATAPRALTPGRHYRVNEQYYFTIAGNGLVISERKP